MSSYFLPGMIRTGAGHWTQAELGLLSESANPAMQKQPGTHCLQLFHFTPPRLPESWNPHMVQGPGGVPQTCGQAEPQVIHSLAGSMGSQASPLSQPPSGIGSPAPHVARHSSRL